METNYFVLQPDGVIGWIENMPQKPQPEDFLSGDTVTPFGDGYMNWDAFNYACNVWESERQSAISNAIKVRNQGEVKFALHSAHADSKGEWVYNYNTPYPLQCHVEKGDRPLNNCKACNDIGVAHCAHPEECGQIAIGPVAIVTFPSSAGVEETQEELWKQMFQQIGSRMDFMQFLLEHYTITRKNK